MTFQIYEDRNRGWRWRALADNGRIVADSGEAYTSKGNVSTGIQRFIASVREHVEIEAVPARESP